MADKRFIISIGRECGSGGHEIGEKLAEHYGIKLYDKNILDLLAEETGKDPGELAKMEESVSGWLPARKGGFLDKEKDLMNRLSDSDRMYLYERAIIQRLAAKESFVIIGRGANPVLESDPDTLRLFVYAPDSFKIPRVKEYYRLDSDKDAEKKMNQIDKERKEYFEYYTGKAWGGKDCHDFSIDSSMFGIDGTVDLIIRIADKKLGL